MDKTRIAVIGYGNIGKAAIQAIQTSPDCELAGIVRRSTEHIPVELNQVKVVTDIAQLDKVDVALLCTPTRKVAEYAVKILKHGIHTVDSFDIHTDIYNLRQQLMPIARLHKAVSIISAGWDPGSDSVIRTLMQAMAPQGITYTNFGPGMSMGHTVAVKAITGVKKALSMTIPLGTGIHRRMVYVEPTGEQSIEQIIQDIKSDPYFANDETHVIITENVDELIDMGHGVHMIRKGVSGKTHNQHFEWNMRINNPALTGQIMVACARACCRIAPGAYTMIEIPPIELLPGNKEELIKQLV